MVTTETHPQAEGCLQDNKLATEVDLNSTDGRDRWDHHCPIDLENREKLITIMLRECKEERTDIIDNRQLFCALTCLVTLIVTPSEESKQ